MIIIWLWIGRSLIEKMICICTNTFEVFIAKMATSEVFLCGKRSCLVVAKNSGVEIAS
ncbi:hypothetical protein [Candidatus Enterococcus clewellii]|uniref:hypothetical protein n=1 Tax=Candidatus Enterococcus clewellii TaxID=1834193 RepID=UPI00148321D5|nr:hypothetical protein [Enterococcus sp. 9E7_DIV0242]